MAKEYIEREMTCGDCIHADVCEEAETLPKFNKENVAYCGMFMKAADVVEVVRCRECEYGEWDESEQLYKCNYAEDDLIPTYEEADFYCARGKRRDNNAAD